jgi:protein TonB
MRFKQDSRRERRISTLSIFLGIVLSGGIFLLIPFLQLMQESPEYVESLEAIAVAPPPPPPPPIEEPPPPPEEDEVDPPELDTPPPMPTLDQLDLALNPGTGGNLGITMELGINFETESVTEMMDLFGFEDLDEIPRVVRNGRIEYPANLRRQRIEGFVRLLIIIDESGRVTVSDVEAFSHKDFVSPARRGAEATRFSPPTRNGQPVRARYNWELKFELQ